MAAKLLVCIYWTCYKNYVIPFYLSQTIPRSVQHTRMEILQPGSGSNSPIFLVGGIQCMMKKWTEWDLMFWKK